MCCSLASENPSELTDKRRTLLQRMVEQFKDVSSLEPFLGSSG
jgi:hypothetical protein